MILRGNCPFFERGVYPSILRIEKSDSLIKKKEKKHILVNLTKKVLYKLIKMSDNKLSENVAQDDEDDSDYKCDDRSRSRSRKKKDKSSKKSFNMFNEKIILLNQKVDNFIINNKNMIEIIDKKVDEANQHYIDLNTKIDVLFSAINVMNDINKSKDNVNHTKVNENNESNNNNNSNNNENNVNITITDDLEVQKVNMHTNPKRKAEKMENKFIISKHKISRMVNSLPNDVNTNRFSILDDDTEMELDEPQGSANATQENSDKVDDVSNQKDPDVEKTTNDNGNFSKNFPPLIKDYTIQNVSTELSNSIKSISSSANVKNSHSKINNVKKPNSNLQNSGNSNKVETKNIIPPIIAYSIDQKLFREALIKLKIHKYFIKKGANDNRFIIYAEDLTTYNVIKKMLSDDQKNFFTFTPKGERGINLILKGVPPEYSLDEVIDELTRLGHFKQIEKVTKLEEGNKVKFNYFIVKLKKDANISYYSNLRYLFNMRIYFCNFHRTDIIQCYNCQRPGHVADNCNMATRCVKCSQNHRTIDCNISSERPSNELVCTLCKGKGHPASYRGCPVIKKLLKEKIKNKTLVRRGHTGTVNSSVDRSRVVPNISFAAVARNNGTNQSGSGNGRSKILDLLDQEAFTNFGLDFKTLDGKFKNFIKGYGSCVEPSQKKFILLDFMFDTVTNG